MRGYFDGASRGNPGEAGAGSLLVDDSGAVIWESAAYMGRATNNEAEYAALLALLDEIERRGARGVQIFGDSKLVVMQTRGEWKVRKAHLGPPCARAREIIARTGCTIEWIPREQNAKADALSNKAIDEAAR